MLALFGFSSPELVVLAILSGGGVVLLGVAVAFIYLVGKRQ